MYCALGLIIRLHHYHVKTIVFVSIIILFFFANELYRTNMAHIRVWTPSEPKYTDPVSATFTHFSRSQTQFSLTRKLKTSNPYNFVIYDRILMKLHRNGPPYDAMLLTYFSVTLTYFFRSNSKSTRNFLSSVWPNLVLICSRLRSRASSSAPCRCRGFTGPIRIIYKRIRPVFAFI